MTRIIHAETPLQVNQARVLFRDYATSLDFDLCFQDLNAELHNVVYPAGETISPGQQTRLEMRARMVSGKSCRICLTSRPIYENGNVC